MEIKKRISFGQVFIFLYVFSFAVYLIIGLQPAEAIKSPNESLNIPSINLNSGVIKMELINGGIPTPDTLVGNYSPNPHKTFLYGHSTGVFSKLQEVSLGDKINYNGKEYRVIEKETVLKENAKMNEILKTEEKDTLIIMTCSGTLYDDGDASHRLLVKAIE